MRIPPPRKRSATGVILAGGRGRRLGGEDKGLVRFEGRPLVEWVIEAIAPQVGRLLINANRHQAIYAVYGLPVVHDELEGFQGPLAGIASAMRAACTPWIVTLPCDNPFPPTDLVEMLRAVLAERPADIAVAADRVGIQPVYALMPVSLADDLCRFLATGERKISRWYSQHQIALADFSDRDEGFANINSTGDAACLARRLSHLKKRDG